MTEEMNPIVRLSRDLKEAAITLSTNEARYLVDAYYQIQEYRKTAVMQTNALASGNEPHAVIEWLAQQNESLENQIRRALDRWSSAHPTGIWAKSIVGIGPVISAGLLAHIDITKAPTVGHIWRFAGIDPTLVWEKKTKRPFNASLKTLCWKIGESFVKVSNHKDDVYGKVYQERKVLEESRNAEGAFAAQAAAKLAQFNIGKTTEAYGHYITGHLPPAHIHARAKRYAVKLFLSHFHHVAFVNHYNLQPPKPYIIEHGGHTHFVAPPNFPLAA